MKKIVLLLLGGSAFFISCSNEVIAMDNQESAKTVAMQNFKQAVIHFNKPENLPSEEERRNRDFPKWSAQNLDLLVPASKSLIRATGVEDKDIMKATNGEKDLIVEWALKIFNDNNIK